MLVVSDALMAGNVRMLRSDSAVGSFLLGLHEKREKVPHPGLQHVDAGASCQVARVRSPLRSSDGHGARAGALYVYRAWGRKGGKADARVKGAPMGGWGVSRARRVRCGADLLPSRLLPSRLLPFI